MFKKDELKFIILCLNFNFLSMYKRFFKRFFDFFFALLGLVFFTPFFLLLALLLFLSTRKQPYFLQVRNGLKGVPFVIVKFKTMTDRKDVDGRLLPDAERITALGTFIRKYSIDELPQLFNVLKGDMSLIGPRPLLPEYMPLYSLEQKRRHDVRPGITGWAQVNGRNAIRWGTKFEYDVWYVDHLSFGLDLKIFFLTLKKVFFSEGINASKDIIAEEFNGNN